LVDAHIILDAKEEANRRAAEKAERESKR
jgi:hypothetical protein